MASTSRAVAGPVRAAQEMMRPGVQAAWRRWDSGMWAGSVVKPALKLRGWEATRRWRWKTSTTPAVSRWSTASPTRR